MFGVCERIVLCSDLGEMGYVNSSCRFCRPTPPKVVGFRCFFVIVKRPISSVENKF